MGLLQGGALVIGGGRGIGAAVVDALAGAGFDVTFTQRSAAADPAAVAARHPGREIRAETLDLSDNRFTKAASVLKGLFSIPNLKSLKIILPEEEEEQIVATLPLLESLNGVLLIDPEAEAEALRREEENDLDQEDLDPAEEHRLVPEVDLFPANHPRVFAPEPGEQDEEL